MQQRVLSTLLNEMDGVEAAGEILLIGATNRLERIDSALLRPGRFDHASCEYGWVGELRADYTRATAAVC